MTPRFFLMLLTLVMGCTPSVDSSKTIPEVELSSVDPSLANAILAAQKSVREKPDSAETWGRLGQCLEAAEFLEQARASYERATRLEPDSGRWSYLLSLLEMPEQPEAALVRLRHAVNLIPATNDASRLRLAQCLTERGQYPEASLHLEKLLAANPGHPAARIELARVKYALNDLTGASDLLPPCLTNAYTARAAHLLLSQIRQRQGQPSEAALLAERAASMPRPFDWPDPYLREVQSLRMNPQNLADRAQALMMQRRWPEAERVLQELVDRDPADAEALLLLGRLRIQQRRCAEAEEVLQRHLAVKTNSLQGFVQMGLARFCGSRWAEAEEAFRMAIKLKPDFAQAHYNLGLTLSRANQSPAAIEAFREAARCQPGEANTHAALAEEHLRLGDVSAAQSEVESALRIDPQHPKALRTYEAINRRK